MFHTGWFLIGCESPQVAQAVGEVVRPYGVARRVECWAQLVEAASTGGRYAGAVLCARDPALLVERARALRVGAPLLPALALVERPTACLLSALHAAHVEVAGLPVALPSLTGFVQRALVFGYLPDDRLARAVQTLAQDARLSAREVQLLAAALGDEPRARLRRRLGITENTLKTQVRGLLRKCGERSMDGLAKNVLRVTLLGARPKRARDAARAA